MNPTPELHLMQIVTSEQSSWILTWFLSRAAVDVSPKRWVGRYSCHSFLTTGCENKQSMKGLRAQMTAAVKRSHGHKTFRQAVNWSNITVAADLQQPNDNEARERRGNEGFWWKNAMCGESQGIMGPSERNDDILQQKQANELTTPRRSSNQAMTFYSSKFRFLFHENKPTISISIRLCGALTKALTMGSRSNSYEQKNLCLKP